MLSAKQAAIQFPYAMRTRGLVARDNIKFRLNEYPVPMLEAFIGTNTRIGGIHE